jgi:hypothetical protein
VITFSRDDSSRSAGGPIDQGCSADAFGGGSEPSQLNFGATDMLGDVTRMFTIDWFEATRTAGSELDLAADYDYQASQGGHASYTELLGDGSSRGWEATGGKLRIESVEGDAYVVSIEDAHFEPLADPFGGASSSGSFDVNGRISAVVIQR